MPRSRLLWITLVLPVLLVIWYVCNTDRPLGVLGEWVWERQDLEPESPWYLAMIPAAATGVVFMTYVWLGAPRIARCSKAEIASRVT